MRSAKDNPTEMSVKKLQLCRQGYYQAAQPRLCRVSTQAPRLDVLKRRAKAVIMKSSAEELFTALAMCVVLCDDGFDSC
ncbi:unnamed protein product [Cylicocyclus nassatus]|uniref:Uncharacterized protein n=1 Tax=Cylicocyclus nassatus TaxID=53992 RepID=A0AA36H5E6_CYLNA|nr:unnamed protein product [Cylicocyclus nassatus]